MKGNTVQSFGPVQSSHLADSIHTLYFSELIQECLLYTQGVKVIKVVGYPVCV